MLRVRSLVVVTGTEPFKKRSISGLGLRVHRTIQSVRELRRL